MSLSYEANISSDLLQRVPIVDLVPHPDNPREHRVELIAQSLMAHGQQKPVVVQRDTNVILAGHGTVEAAKMLGWTEVAIVYSDLVDDAALMYLLDDNKASDVARYKKEKLLAGMRKLVEGPGLTDSLWTVEEFADLDEEFRGMTSLTDTASEAAKLGERPGEEDAAAERIADSRRDIVAMKEVPLSMTAAEHVRFIAELGVLRARYGIKGTGATIVEAVRRQAAAENEAVLVGRKPDEEQRISVVREFGHDLQAAFKAIGIDPIPLNRVRDFIERSLPADPTPSVPDVVPGQTEAFPEPGEAPSVVEQPEPAGPDLDGPEPLPAPETPQDPPASDDLNVGAMFAEPDAEEPDGGLGL